MEICLYMGGATDFNTAWGMCFTDRELAVKVINRKIKRENPDGKEYM